MIAAIYARKSTEQAVADEAKSVRRQIDHAHQYAARKGWTVSEAHVFVDDGVSGAEFANRPGFMRLMNSLKPRPAFDVLIMSEDSRLGREAIETAYALKQIIGAGVRVFTYLDDRERTLDSPTEKILMSLTAYASEMEREQSRARMVDTMTRKARAGHVTGGQCYGYDNARVESHVEHRINEAEAAVVRRIFELAATGASQVAIAKTLNAEGHPAPRAQQGRPRAWSPSSVHEALHRPRYRGELVWNLTQKRNRFGERKVTRRREEDRIVVPAPHLRIIPEALWQAAHTRIAAARQRTNVWRGPECSTYLLPGHARCGWCGGGIHVRSRQQTSGRHRFYACTSHYNRGEAVCRNVVQVPMADMDAAVLRELRNIVSPVMVEAVVEGVREAAAPSHRVTLREQLEAEIEALDGQMFNLTEAIAVGGEMAVLVAKLRTVDDARQEARRKLDALTEAPVPRINWRRTERQVRGLMTDWRGLLNRNTVEARQVLAALLREPIVMTPIVREDRRGYRFEGRAEIGGFLAGSIEVMNVVSPGRIELPA